MDSRRYTFWYKNKKKDIIMTNYITSIKLIKEIIKQTPQQISKLYISQNAAGEEIKNIVELAKKKGVSFQAVPKQKLLGIFNQGYSGVLLVLSPVRFLSLEELLKKNQNKEKCVFLVLDEINDPQNFGAIIRTAVAFEVNGIIIQQWNQVMLTQTVVEVSRGGVYKIDIAKVKNVYNAVKKLKELNYWVYATVPPNSVLTYSIIDDLSSLKDFNKMALVLGNENKGVRKNIISECDGVITIKHSEKMESLNVSVTCGIILYEIYKNLNG
jgi:23S rRNA (guanosine2251-2'-O)-methyltransferase